MPKPVVVTAYFSGTALSIAHPFWLGSFLYQTTQTSEIAFKHGFDGTRLTNGWLGLLFGAGIDKQCRTVTLQVRDLIQQGHQVILNCYGHSRGAVTAFFLAKMLGNIHRDYLETNLVLHDPVPGNLISTPYFDTFNITLTNQIMDLSQCKNLNSVLCLYTHEPSPSYHCCAPIFPSYPANCQVEADVIPGQHANAQVIRSYRRLGEGDTATLVGADFTNDAPSLIAFIRVRAFLFAHGTSFTLPLTIDYENKNFDTLLDTAFARSVEINKLLPIYMKENDRLDGSAAFVNKCHAVQPIHIATDPGPDIIYLNRHHKQLITKQPITSIDDCHLRIERASPNWLERLMTQVHKHPYLITTIKFAFLGAIVATAVYFSGGLAALPLLAPFIQPLGLSAIAAIAPLCALAAATIWYTCLKPIITTFLKMTCLVTPDDSFATSILERKYRGKTTKSSTDIYRGLNAAPVLASAASTPAGTATMSLDIFKTSRTISFEEEERKMAEMGRGYRRA